MGSLEIQTHYKDQKKVYKQLYVNNFESLNEKFLENIT